MRGLRRFIAYLLIGGGLVLLADAAITLAWQEPVSALVARHEQSKLSHQLAGLERQSAADTRVVRPSPQRLAELARRELRRVGKGQALGRIRLPTLHRSYVMVQGTDSSSLRKGPGHYPGTALPGQPGTVAVAGHRTTYLAPFRTINKLHAGDAVVLQMPYGRFTYRVQTTRIVEPGALWVTHNAGYQRLVLSACHPLYSAAKRIVVFARLASATT
ncbi:MAG TPA: class E sortase, partial [Candidatus Dormibacteraeota bacterium]|nr:class E sortase [Candidatus Dormibacteraeota bacterium]